MTEQEFDGWFEAHGFKRTGESTSLIEEWVNEAGETVWVTRPSELSPDDRAATIDWIRKSLAIDFPIGGGGVH